MPDAKPAASRTVLYYTGDASGQPSIHGIPARDLTQADIARLAYVESTRAGKRVPATAVAERLAATPLYRRTNPTPSTKSARRPSAAAAAKPAAPTASPTATEES